MLKSVKKFLKKIEQQNADSFGNSKLDCCDLNKKKESKDNKKTTDFQ